HPAARAGSGCAPHDRGRHGAAREDRAAAVGRGRVAAPVSRRRSAAPQPPDRCAGTALVPRSGQRGGLSPRKKELPVGLPGLEPGTSSLSAKRSNRLSYSPEREPFRGTASPTVPHASARSQNDQLFWKPTRMPPVNRTLRL